jgi:alanine racemase
VEIFRKTWAEIHVSNLQNNLELIRNSFPADTFLCPMIKANGYGHGDAKLAELYQSWNVKTLGVCLIEEGVLIRRLGIEIPILVFRGFDREGARALKKFNLTPVVSTMEQLQILSELNEPQILHLKFDTGMNRLGLNSEQANQALEILKHNQQLRLGGVLTHLFQSEDGLEINSLSRQQINKFYEITQFFAEMTDTFHVLNSGGVICRMKSQDPIYQARNWGLRPGLMLYGYNPVANVNLDLKPALTLKSHTSVIRNISKGEGVSYNHTWIAEKDSRIAVVPIGYADGWHRILSNKSQVLWNGEKAPIVGNICMDYLMVDVTDHKVLPENEVVFFGQSRTGAAISALDVAQLAQTIPWEILTSVGERVPRLYV